MNLLPAYIRKQLPKLYATEHVKPADKISVVRLFTPDSNWLWHIVEFDGEDTLFGFVIGLEAEWGYISLSELQSVRGPMGLRIERDRYWRPKPMREAEPARFPGEGEQP
jgi:hypothetical protein